MYIITAHGGYRPSAAEWSRAYIPDYDDAVLAGSATGMINFICSLASPAICTHGCTVGSAVCTAAAADNKKFDNEW